MRQTSSSYEPFPRRRDVDCLIRFRVMDSNASDPTVAVNSHFDALSGVSRNVVKDKTLAPDGKYADFEPNLWQLDGTFDTVPDDITDVNTGLWSALTASSTGLTYWNGSRYVQTVTLTLDTDVSTLGWTFHFDSRTGYYPQAISIQVFTYADGTYTLAETLTASPDSAEFMYQHYSENYRRIRVWFSKSQPYRRIRLNEIEFGITKRYNRNSLAECSIKYDVDPACKSISSRELTFAFDNSDKQYNLLNPDGVYQYLQNGQEITAWFSIGGEEVDMGTFFFTKADVSKSAIVPTVQANDRIYVLDGADYNGGANTETTLSAAVTTILSGYNITANFNGYGSTAVVMAIPTETKLREALRLLAQAARTTVYIDRDGVMQFVRLSVAQTADGTLTGDELYDWQGVTVEDVVDSVKLYVRNEYAETSVTYVSGSGERVKTFSNPCVASSEGQNVADWLLTMSNWRKHYQVENRCDPSVELGDTLNIEDTFGNQENAVVTGIDITYDGTLKATTTAGGL